jgi:hypothetical protein
MIGVVGGIRGVLGSKQCQGTNPDTTETENKQKKKREKIPL